MVSIAAAAAEWTEPHHWGVTDYPFYENSSMPAMEAGPGPGIGSVLLLVAVVLYVAAVVCILCIFVGS